MAAEQRARAWRKLAKEIRVPGPIRLTFRVAGPHGDLRMIALAEQLPRVDDPKNLNIAEDAMSVHDLQISVQIPRTLAPHPRWFLAFARWIFLHELDEWWTTPSGRTRNPHTCDGRVRTSLTTKRLIMLANLDL